MEKYQFYAVMSVLFIIAANVTENVVAHVLYLLAAGCYIAASFNAWPKSDKPKGK